MRSGILLGALVALSAVLWGCGGTASNNSSNNTIRNAGTNAPNSNVYVVNNNSNNAPIIDRTNSNISREQYDKNRAEYEKDKGSSTIGQGVNDSWIWFKTRAALAAANDLRDSTINVDVANDVVTLKGTVATAAQKAAAEKTAKGIDGVKSVKNELVVKPDGSSASNANANANKR